MLGTRGTEREAWYYNAIRDHYSQNDLWWRWHEPIVKSVKHFADRLLPDEVEDLILALSDTLPPHRLRSVISRLSNR